MAAYETAVGSPHKTLLVNTRSQMAASVTTIGWLHETLLIMVPITTFDFPQNLYSNCESRISIFGTLFVASDNCLGMLCPTSLHARLVETLNIEGCGFVLVELPGVCHGLCIASLYLHDSLGITLEPNKTIFSHPDGFAQAHKELGCHWRLECPNSGHPLHLDDCLSSRSVAGLIVVLCVRKTPTGPGTV